MNKGFYNHHEDGKHASYHIVYALVWDSNTVEDSATKMYSFRPILICIIIIWEELRESCCQDYSICPVTTPCHCESDDVINCASRRLKKLPFFLDFKIIWADLNLSDNLLHQLTAQSLESIRVRKLDLSENIITLIHQQAFIGTQGIEHLELSHNYLSYLPTDMYNDLPLLKVLNLAYNRFKNLQDDMFVKTVQLYELDLSGNELKTVPSASFEPLKHLGVLKLRNNGIRVILPSSFIDLPLERLDLGDNHVPLQIYPKAFCGLKPRVTHVEAGVRDWSGLQTLLLDHNGITHVDPCWSKIAWLLQTVDLSGNPIVCDCNLKYLKSFSKHVGFHQAQCASPDDFAGNFVDTIPAEKFNCSEFRTMDETSERCNAQCHVSTQQMPNSANGLTSSGLTMMCFAFLTCTFLKLV